MLSIQSSSYGVSAVVSSLMPSAAKNGETGTAAAAGNGKSAAVAGTRPASAPPSGAPSPAASAEADKTGDALPLPEIEDLDTFEDTGATTPDDFEAAARFLLDAVDLRELADDNEPGDSGIRFDEAGTYRPAWVK